MSDADKPVSTLFLERRTYRRRRLIDAVKLVPVLGAVVFFLPVLWSGTGLTSRGLLYLFVAWGVLIILMAVLSRAVIKAVGTGDHGEPGSDRDRG
ncbi:MAG: hypothetical protein AAGM21_04280 [Pseudomonadota bacterium]